MEKYKVVFLLQNGIGFGHFRLALSIAGCLSRDRVEVIFLTQAKSTRVFESQPYKVINLPKLYALRSNNEVLLFDRLVNAILEHIRPDIVIEDTYPDDFYLNLPILVTVPRLLILNRLIASEFENMYYNGSVGRYDYLFVLKHREQFLSSFQATEVRNFAAYSSRIVYCGDVFNEPTEQARIAIRKKYKMDAVAQTVVINCGAGGWHMGENVCRVIFERIVSIADLLADSGVDCRFIMLTGPYSSYIAQTLGKQIRHPDCIQLVDFEDHSDALFREADLVILRPGYNSTMEALAGTAKLILLPGISYMEDQVKWCKELEKQYGISFLSVDRLDLLEASILSKLAEGRCAARQVTNNVSMVAAKIEEILAKNRIPPSTTLVLAMSKDGSRSEKLNEAAERLAERFGLAWYTTGTLRDCTTQLDVINDSDIQRAEDNPPDAVAVFLDETLENRQLSFFENRYHYEERGILVMPLMEVVIRDECFTTVSLFHVLKKPNLYSNCVVFRFSDAPEAEEPALAFLELLERLLEEGILRYRTIREWLSGRMEEKLCTYRQDYYRPEITKLK